MNHYDLLGISREAGAEELEERYHELAKKYHPDKCKVPGAHEIFIRIKEAYETLSDPQKKKVYDESIESMFSEGGFEKPSRKDVSADPCSGSCSSFESSVSSPSPEPSGPFPDSPDTQCSPQTYSLSFVPVGGLHSGPRGPFRSSIVSYIPFRPPLAFRGSSRPFSVSGDGSSPECLKNVVSKNSPDPHQFKNGSYKTGLQSPLRPFMELDDQEKIRTDMRKKARGLPIRFILRKLCQYSLILIFILLALTLLLPSSGAADASYMEKFEIVIESLKSFNI